MHVLLVMVGGVLLLGVFLLFGRLWSVGQSQLPTALLAFIATWLLVTLANMWVGVSKADSLMTGSVSPRRALLSCLAR